MISGRKITRQSVPDDDYLLLLGTAISVFISNNDFVIENILRTSDRKSWYILIDQESGKIVEELEKAFGMEHSEILKLFRELVNKRNRIIHGFRVTSKDEKQIIATKERGAGQQFYIDEKYLKSFIKENEKLSDLLHEYRGF